MAGRFRPRRRGLAALSAAAGLLLAGWLATTPWLLDHWPRALPVALFLLVFVGPRFLATARPETPNDVRFGLVQAVAGVAMIAAVVVIWQQLETGSHQLSQQLEAASREQVSERFARALDQLASQQLDVRLGGIYGLERIAARASEPAQAPAGAYRLPFTDAPVEPSPDWWAAQDRAQVFEILAAYVRSASHRPPDGPNRLSASLQLRQPDLYAAMTVLGRRTVLDGDAPLDLSGSVLVGARLGSARLAGADLRRADVRGAGLQQAELAGARLEQSLLCGAQLQGADLRGAYLAGARVSAATRWPAGFNWKAAGARLVEAC